jgi:hypothetical protein
MRMLDKLTDFVKSEVRPYLANPNKKPIGDQFREFVALFRAYGVPPYQYFKTGLYDRVFAGNTAEYLPPTVIYGYLSNVNPPKSRPYAKDKLLFRRTLEEAGLPVVRELFRITPEGAILDPDDRPLAPEAARAAILAQAGDVFVKPIDGTWGRGAFVPGPGDLDALLGQARNVLVQPRIVQHPVLSALYPHSVNTVRIDTLKTDRGWIHDAAVLRVGVGGAVVDNGSAGGILAGIDLETGRLYPRARQRPKFNAAWYERHPDTGVAFGGITVPHWDLVRETVVRAAEAMLPHGLTSVGWDVAVLPEGVVLIEANHNWDVTVMQIGWGGLAGTEIGRRALRHRGLAA